MLWKKKKSALTQVIKASLLENYDTLSILADILRTTGARDELLNLGKAGNRTKEKWLSRDWPYVSPYARI